MDFFFQILRVLETFYTSSVMTGVLCFLLVLFFLRYLLENSQSTFSMMFELLYEKIYDFYEEILGKEAKRILPYIISLFFVILGVNLLGVIGDFIAPIFGISHEGDFRFHEFFIAPSSDLHFNLAAAGVSVILIVGFQLYSLGFKKTLYEYFPIYGKGYISITSGALSKKLLFVLQPFVKIIDIILSVFLSFLDIIGLFAKVVSLSFRLFGNMLSGGVLLVLLIAALNDMTQKMSYFLGGIDFPIVFPLILYLQGILVACIQAMVFALLVAIFIRVSQLETSESSGE